MTTNGIFTVMNSVLTVRKIVTLSGHSSAVYTLAPAGEDSFYSGSGDKIVAEWRPAFSEEGVLVARIPDIVYSLFPDPENDRLLVGQATGAIHVINLSLKTETRQLKYHTQPIFHICSSVSHDLLFSLSGDGGLGVMNARTLTPVKMISLGNVKLRTAAVKPDETILAVGASNGKITVYSLPDLEEIKQWQAHEVDFSVYALAFSPDGKQLLSGARDAHLNIYDVPNDFTLIQSIPAHNYAIYAIAFNNDGSLFATCSRDKTIKLWNPETFEVLLRIDNERSEGHVNSVNKIIWHPETGQLISAGDDRAIMVWEVEHEKF